MQKIEGIKETEAVEETEVVDGVKENCEASPSILTEEAEKSNGASQFHRLEQLEQRKQQREQRKQQKREQREQQKLQRKQQKQELREPQEINGVKNHYEESLLALTEIFMNPAWPCVVVSCFSIKESGLLRKNPDLGGRVGQAIKKYRQANNIRQQDFADLINVVQGQISKSESYATQWFLDQLPDDLLKGIHLDIKVPLEECGPIISYIRQWVSSEITEIKFNFLDQFFETLRQKSLVIMREESSYWEEAFKKFFETKQIFDCIYEKIHLSIQKTLELTLKEFDKPKKSSEDSIAKTVYLLSKSKKIPQIISELRQHYLLMERYLKSTNKEESDLKISPPDSENCGVLGSSDFFGESFFEEGFFEEGSD